MNYLVTVSYDGSQFHGWAKQVAQRTVQGEIEDILKRICKQDIMIEGSGRTDAFVHAYNQTFTFKVKDPMIPKNALLKAFNHLAPFDLCFKSIKIVHDKFHARFNSKLKTYQYKINLGRANIFNNNYELHYAHKIDLKKMKAGAKLFIGKHDFKSFSKSELPETKRTIKAIKFTKTKDQHLYITITGDGFLRNMVRMIVGSLLDLNEKTKSLDDIKRLLAQPKKGSSVTKVRAAGLYLVKVQY